MSTGYVLKGLTILLVLTALFHAGDVDKFIFLDLDVGDEFPYVVIGERIEQAPVAYIALNRTVYLVDFNANITYLSVVGKYLVVPREAVNNAKAQHPKAVDVDIEGVGRVRLILARNTTELHGGVIARKGSQGNESWLASRVELVILAEERGGKFYIDGKPIDIRRPKNSLRKPSPKGIGGEAGIMGFDSGTSSTSFYWSTYVFAPTVYANVQSSYLYTPASFIIATGFNPSSRTYNFIPKSSSDSYWAYLGKDVVRVYVQVTWKPDITAPNFGEPGPDLRLYIAYSQFPQPTVPSTQSWTSSSSPLYNISNVLRKMYIFDTSAYSNYYIYVYTIIRNPSYRPINISLMAVYRRPGLSISDIYGSLAALWRWDAKQPGVVFSYDSYSGRDVFLAVIPQGFNEFANFYARLKTSFGCNANARIDVTIGSLYLGSFAPTSIDTSTGTCTFVISSLFNLLEAAKWYFSFNASPVLPIVFTYRNTGSRITVEELYIQGSRWPEIWSHNSATWLSAKLIFSNLPNRYELQRRTHLRDFYTYAVRYTSGVFAGSIAALAQIRHTGFITPSGLNSFAMVSYYYTPFRHRFISETPTLKRVCLAVETVGRVPAMAMNITERRNLFLDALVSATGAAVTAASFVVAVLSFFTGSLSVAVAGAILWGLDVLLGGVSVSSNISCIQSSPVPYYGIGYDAGTAGSILGAHWDVYIPYFGDTNQLIGISVRYINVDGYFKADNNYAQMPLVSYSPYLLRTVIALRDVSNYFVAPEEPYALAWAGYLIKFS